LSTRTLSLVLAAISLAGFGTLMGLRDSLTWVTGDEGTYMAMTASLVRDGDLVFSEPDLEHVRSAPLPGERELILQRTALGITYSKPVLYPLAAAPFYLVAGRLGPVLVNALALGGALWLTLLYLRRLGRRNLALTMITFFGASALLPYVVWRMSDALLVAATLSGLVLSLAAVRRSDDRSLYSTPFFDGSLAPLLGGLLLGLAAAMRYPNALLALAALVALVWLKEWNRAALLLLGVALAAVLSVGATSWLTGAPDPYRTPRSTFNPAVGYPAGPDSAVARERLAGDDLATVRLRTTPRPAVVGYSTLYFFVGRHTGLLIYFPAAVVFALLALRRPDKVSIALLASVGGIALFYLLLLPHNYFGGGAAIGNRYFLAAYPALLVAQRELPERRWLLLPWLVAIVALFSAVASVWTTSGLFRGSQAHAHAGLFRMLPYESTLQSIEGSKERFWLHDWEWEMLHFTDPYSRVGRFAFTLEAGAPPTEIEVANTRGDNLLRFLVSSEAPKLLLDFSDWGRSETFELEPPLGERGAVDIVASTPWRRHPLWFHWRLHDVFLPRLIRLGIRTPDGSPATAQVRYLGSVEIPTDIYSFDLLEADLPTLAGAGTISSVPLRVRNTSSETWKSDRVLAVYLSYKLFYRTEGGVQMIEGARTPLPHAIEPGEVLDTTVRIRWPELPRNYGLGVDLVHEGIAWFEERNGSPLARSEVKVIALPETTTPAEGAAVPATGEATP
jgi:4-amino-4-deoxy-L-arabinose transferase-like glycosyltransferase